MKWYKGITDFRGLSLCEGCWNGVHFITDIQHKKISNCAHDGCQCPCQDMEKSNQVANAKKRSIKLKDKQAQVNGYEVWPMMSVGMKAHNDEG